MYEWMYPSCSNTTEIEWEIGFCCLNFDGNFRSWLCLACESWHLWIKWLNDTDWQTMNIKKTVWEEALKCSENETCFHPSSIHHNCVCCCRLVVWLSKGFHWVQWWSIKFYELSWERKLNPFGVQFNKSGICGFQLKFLCANPLNELTVTFIWLLPHQSSPTNLCSFHSPHKQNQNFPSQPLIPPLTQL